MAAVIDIVAYGASPDKPDNTDFIQKALDDAKAGDTVYVPSGVFLVDAVRSLLPRSGTKLAIDGTLRAIPNDKVISVVVNLSSVSNVVVSGSGQIVGEKAGHFGMGPNRGGMCLAVFSSSNVRLGGGLTLREGFADGIYVQDAKNLTVDGVNCVGNARNGLSIISAEKMIVTNSLFTLTSSEAPMPQAGIDIEPDTPAQSLLDISISGNRFVRNRGAGCYIAFSPAPNRARIFVVDNQFDQHYKDGSGPPIGGRNSVLANLLYACCRWIPGYDYWSFPSEFTQS